METSCIQFILTQGLTQSLSKIRLVCIKTFKNPSTLRVRMTEYYNKHSIAALLPPCLITSPIRAAFHLRTNSHYFRFKIFRNFHKSINSIKMQTRLKWILIKLGQISNRNNFFRVFLDTQKICLIERSTLLLNLPELMGFLKIKSNSYLGPCPI